MHEAKIIFHGMYAKLLPMLDTWLQVDADVFGFKDPNTEDNYHGDSQIVLFKDYWVHVELKMRLL